MTHPSHPTVWLHHAGQHLGLVPTLGGAVAAWQGDWPSADAGKLDLWRPWDGCTEDMYQLASFAMVPWSNRISHGGFAQDGRFHPMALNRAGEPYPIHGDGWLQPWVFQQVSDDTVQMSLRSRHFQCNPYDYEALQTFRLLPGMLEQTVTVRHLGPDPLPYGMGVHPWFLRTPGTRIAAPVGAVWLCGDDPIPVQQTAEFPQGWDLNQGVSAHGSLIDNAYTGWGGTARIEWPEWGARLSVSMPDFERDGGSALHYCHIYRPPQGGAFCFEPITQPIDAFHLPGRPGLRVLAQGQATTLRMQWHYEAL
jgi:aldose 1-epimerase